MSNKFEPRPKEFFECECHGKDDLIRAEYDVDEWRSKDGTIQVFRELHITFTTRAADYHSTYRDGFIGWLKRMKWRIKNSFKILITGEIRTEGYFSPCRTFVNEKENPVEGVFGYETSKNLAKWIDTMADKIKEDFDRDYKEYLEKLNSNVEAKSEE